MFEPAIFLPESLCSQLNLDTLEVAISRTRLKAHPRPYPVAANTAKLSPPLAASLSVPSDLTWRFSLDQGNSFLKLGPVVAIFTRRLPSPGSKTGTDGELNYLGKLSQSLPGLYYVVLPPDVKADTALWTGYVYQDGAWVEREVPRPQAVYDQIYSRRSEHRADVMAAHSVLWQTTGGRYFNPGYFNKWEVTELLSRTSVRTIMPETQLITSSMQVRQMIQRWGVVFLKPTGGTFGLGVLRLSRHGTYYVLKSYQGITRRYTSFDSAYEAARKNFTSKNYLVQQGIDLMRFKGCPFDVRALIQKDGKGQFQITKIFARVAPGTNRITTNLKTGGIALPLPAVLPARHHRVIRKLKATALEISRALDNASRTTYGELGIDLGIDRNLRVWLIEVNAKPRRTVETEGNPELVRLSYLRPLQYAAYLAGFGEVG